MLTSWLAFTQKIPRMPISLPLTENSSRCCVKRKLSRAQSPYHGHGPPASTQLACRGLHLVGSAQGEPFHISSQGNGQPAPCNPLASRKLQTQPSSLSVSGQWALTGPQAVPHRSGAEPVL